MYPRTEESGKRASGICILDDLPACPPVRTCRYCTCGLCWLVQSHEHGGGLLSLALLRFQPNLPCSSMFLWFAFFLLPCFLLRQPLTFSSASLRLHHGKTRKIRFTQVQSNLFSLTIPMSFCKRRLFAVGEYGHSCRV